MVRDTDGSAFITKAEFDSLKNNFQSQIDSYNTSIDAKIDGAIASYLSGMKLTAAWTLSATGGVNFRNKFENSSNYNRFLITHNRYTSVNTVASVRSFSPDPTPVPFPSGHAPLDSSSMVYGGCGVGNTASRARLALHFNSTKIVTYGSLPTEVEGTGSSNFYGCYVHFTFTGTNNLEPLTYNCDGGAQTCLMSDIYSQVKYGSATTNDIYKWLGIAADRYSSVTIATAEAEAVSTGLLATKLYQETPRNMTINGSAPTSPTSTPVVGRRDAAVFTNYDIRSHSGSSPSTQLLTSDAGKLQEHYARDTGILTQINISRFRYHDETSNYTNSTNMKDTSYTSDMLSTGTAAATNLVQHKRQKLSTIL